VALSAWIPLPTPATWGRAEVRAFIALARSLKVTTKRGQATTEAARRLCLRGDRPGLAAAACVLSDLVSQGWAVRVDTADRVSTRPPKVVADPTAEKLRVRRQELLKRDEQLAAPSVRRFVAEMERPREFAGRFVSIFSLMRDGQELRSALEAVATVEDASALRTVIDPYVQVVTNTDRCRHTGLRLGDIWRYFRHTWSNQYTSTPGRTMLLLVRDRAAPFHPVIGIAALGSPIVQIKERDDWIGWQSSDFVTRLAERPTLTMARWVVRRLDQAIQELHLDDLLEDGLYWPSLWSSPTADAIDRLRKEAEARRNDHRRFVRRADFKRSIDATDVRAWRRQAESDLFRSKRCLALADLLRSRAALDPFLYPNPSRAGLADALDDADGRRAIAGIVRRAKAEAIGTEMADLTVCGAIAPYNALLGGKLVSMLAVSPSVIHAYRERYADYASVIASSMAGRPVRRRANLVFVGTTSLYGSGSSQYNRVRIPAEVLGGKNIVEFRELGRSRSFGTSHLSRQTVTALVRLSEQSRTGIRVNSIFGEGVNPKLRKARDGIDLLGWPSEDLLMHGRQRIVYGVNLVSNLLPYLIDAEVEPQYLFRRNLKDDVGKISEWWIRRWLSPRVQSAEVLAAVAEHSVERPVRHGARVPSIALTTVD
jgi:Domain of unknown function (DUF4338)